MSSPSEFNELVNPSATKETKYVVSVIDDKGKVVGYMRKDDEYVDKKTGIKVPYLMVPEIKQATMFETMREALDLTDRHEIISGHNWQIATVNFFNNL